MSPDGLHHGEELRGDLVDAQPQEVADLSEEDQHRDAVGEAHDDGLRHELDQAPEPEEAHGHEHGPRHQRADHQVGEAVTVDDAVDDDDEGAGGAAHRHPGAAESRDQEARDDGGDDAGFGLHSRADGEGHGQGQGDDAHGETGRQIREEGLAGDRSEGLDQSRAEGQPDHADRAVGRVWIRDLVARLLPAFGRRGSQGAALREFPWPERRRSRRRGVPG